MSDTLTDRRLVVVINTHPDRRLSPNASLPSSVAAKRGRQRIVNDARQAGYAAAMATICDLPGADLAWMAGSVDVDILIGWGVGRKTHDDDGAIGSCKSYRDGIADLFGASDRQWRTRRLIQTRAAPTHPHGQVSFTFTPRQENMA